MKELKNNAIILDCGAISDLIEKEENLYNYIVDDYLNGYYNEYALWNYGVRKFTTYFGVKNFLNNYQKNGGILCLFIESGEHESIAQNVIKYWGVEKSFTVYDANKVKYTKTFCNKPLTSIVKLENLRKAMGFSNNDNITLVGNIEKYKDTAQKLGWKIFTPNSLKTTTPLPYLSKTKNNSPELIDQEFDDVYIKDVEQKLQNGWDINKTFEGFTLLELAVLNNKPKIVKYLLEKGADTSVVYKCSSKYHSYSLLKLCEAVSNDCKEIYQLLIQDECVDNPASKLTGEVTEYTPSDA